MKTIEKLGFSRYREVGESVARNFKQAIGYDLPEIFIDFLGFQEPKNMPLNFKFRHSTGEEWEGQVSEFLEIAPHADDLDGLETRVIVRSGETYLPIACDSGGNYFYLNLTMPDAPVVDVDYSTGAISEIAPTFQKFLEQLYSSEEY